MFNRSNQKKRKKFLLDFLLKIWAKKNKILRWTKKRKLKGFATTTKNKKKKKEKKTIECRSNFSIKNKSAIEWETNTWHGHAWLNHHNYLFITFSLFFSNNFWLCIWFSKTKIIHWRLQSVCIYEIDENWTLVSWIRTNRAKTIIFILFFERTIKTHLNCPYLLVWMHDCHICLHIYIYSN